MQMRGTESGKTEASDRKSAGVKKRDGQMNRGEERRRQTDKSNLQTSAAPRAIQGGAPPPSERHRLCECFRTVEVSEYVPVIVKGK